MNAMTTNQEHGLSVWCNACDDFPNEFSAHTARGGIYLTCGECGETQRWEEQ